MKLSGSTKSQITEKDTNGENVPHLDITEVTLVHCKIVNNSYQQDSTVLYIFVPNKLFGQLLDILPKTSIFLKIPKKIKWTLLQLLIKVWNIKYDEMFSSTWRLNIVKGYGFLLFAKNMGKNIGKNISTNGVVNALQVC